MGKVLCAIFSWHILLFLLFSVDCGDEGVVHRVVFVDAFVASHFYVLAVVLSKLDKQTVAL